LRAFQRTKNAWQPGLLMAPVPASQIVIHKIAIGHKLLLSFVHHESWSHSCVGSAFLLSFVVIIILFVVVIPFWHRSLLVVCAVVLVLLQFIVASSLR
jgi:hypothetical protein